MVIIYFLFFILVPFSSWAQEQTNQLSKTAAIKETVQSSHPLLLSLDYMSWQQEGSVKAGSADSKIVLTNQAIGLNGAYSFNLTKFRTFIDGGVFFGRGNVGAEKNVITYEQSDISLWGLKTAIGVGKIVSPSKAEIGLKLPIMYVHQTLNEPSGAKVTDPEAFMLMASLYGRWPFQSWFFQTEFSKFIGNDLTLFSLGAGIQY